MNNSMQYHIGEKPYLIQRPLFLNGITRSGKFLLGKLVSCIQSVEYYQYASILEHLPFLNKMGLVSEEAAIALIRIHVDEHAYNYLIGRNLNSRYSDASSIYNAPHFENYLSRSTTDDIPSLLERFKTGKRLSCFIIHEMLPNIEIYFKAFVNLAHSWYRRGWGNRYTDDSLSFAPVIKSSHSSVPWFAADWKEEYEVLTPVDRIIKSIYWITKEGKNTFDSLMPAQKERIFRITYEEIVEDTITSVQKIASFLDRPVLDDLSAIMGREKVPRKITSESRKIKLADFEREASPSHLEMLYQMIRDYEAHV